MKPWHWGAWVDALPIPEFMAMCCMTPDAPQDPESGLFTVGEFTTRVMRQSRDEIATLRTRLQAIEAETIERCAKVAERLHDEDCGDIPEYCYAARQIAAAIRALTPTQDTGDGV